MLRHYKKWIPYLSIVLLVAIAVISFVVVRSVQQTTFDRSEAYVPVSKKVQDQMASSGTMRMVVDLKSALDIKTVTTKDQLVLHKEQVKKLQGNFENQLQGFNYKVVLKYDLFPTLILDVDTPTYTKIKSLTSVVSSIQEETPSQPQEVSNYMAVTKASDVQNGLYVDGAGTVIAIVDSGIYTASSMFQGKNITEACVASQCPIGTNTENKNVVEGPGMAVPCGMKDKTGVEISKKAGCTHGTKVAGVAAGLGPQTLEGVSFSGVAKGANIIAINTQGLGSDINACIEGIGAVRWAAEGFDGCTASHFDYDIVAFEWILEQVLSGRRIDVVNYSKSTSSRLFDIGTSACYQEDESGNPSLKRLISIIQALKVLNIPVVGATGNNNNLSQMGSPACIREIIATGGLNTSGTGIWRDDLQYDVLRGSNFDSEGQHPNMFLAPAQNVPVAETGNVPYVAKWGTSYAAPMVSGAIALIKQMYPASTWDDIVYRLNMGPKMTIGQGSYSKLDVSAAVTAPARVMSSPTQYGTGTTGTITAWNHADSVLGVSSDGAVLGVGNYGKLLLVTASYQRSNANIVTPGGLTYCGQALTLIRRVSVSGAVTETWYLANPPVGTCQVKATFNVDPGERILTSTTFYNVGLALPVINSSNEYAYTTVSTTQPLSLLFSAPTPAYNSHICTYTVQINSNLTINNMNKTELSSKRGASIQTGLGYTQPLRVAVDNSVLWTGTQSLPASGVCFRVNIDTGFATGTPSPVPTTTPRPSPQPTPIATPRPTPIASPAPSAAPAVVGLTGEYFDNADFTALKYTRVDGGFNQMSFNNPPISGMGSAPFSMRWSGYVYIKTSGNYFFYTQKSTTNGIRFTINNVAIIDSLPRLTGNVPTTHRGMINLIGGKWYPVKIEHVTYSGSASLDVGYMREGMPVREQFGWLPLAPVLKSIPSPVPTPTPDPFRVDLKVNSLDGSVFVTPVQTVIASWTSAGAKSCNGTLPSGVSAWTSAKALSGRYTFANSTTSTQRVGIRCLNAAGQIRSDEISVYTSGLYLSSAYTARTTVIQDGILNTLKTGSYKFNLSGNSGMRLYVDRILLIDDWSGTSQRTKTITFYLFKNASVPIKLEWKSGSTASLTFTSP